MSPGRRQRIRLGVFVFIAVACAAGIAAGDRPRTTLDIRSAKPAPTEPTEPTDTGEAGARPPVMAAARLPAVLVGDGALRGSLHLASMVREGDGFAVPLGGGRRARLTLEPRLQEEAQKLLARSRAPMAAIVVMAPDGRILALAGRKHGPPSDEGAYDLAVKVWAPAASVFKIVTAAALLQSGVGPGQPVCFHGGLRSVMKSNLTDDPRRDRRCEDLTFAVAESQNAVIAKLSHKFLDGKKLSSAAEAFGLGRPTRFALDCEASRIQVPDDELERARFAAGFWSSEISALDGALLAGTVATGGMRVTPRIVAEVIDEHGASHRVVGAAPARAIPATVARSIGRMMLATTESGTAYRAFHDRRGRGPLAGVKVAGKTGSLSRDQPYVGYSWFVGYAPFDSPEVIVSVLLGNSEKWWLKAHTTARLLLEVALKQ